VIGGLGSLVGAVWGAALLVFLPNWTTDLANSFSLSTNVSHNLPIAIYGVVLIAAMLVWPTGIQGGLRAVGGAVRPAITGRGRRAAAEPAAAEAEAEAGSDEGIKASQP
jgi:branched-chain amino acid transport system permease protein